MDKKNALSDENLEQVSGGFATVKDEDILEGRILPHHLNSTHDEINQSIQQIDDNALLS